MGSPYMSDFEEVEADFVDIEGEAFVIGLDEEVDCGEVFGHSVGEGCFISFDPRCSLKTLLE